VILIAGDRVFESHHGPSQAHRKAPLFILPGRRKYSNGVMELMVERKPLFKARNCGPHEPECPPVSLYRPAWSGSQTKSCSADETLPGNKPFWFLFLLGKKFHPTDSGGNLAPGTHCHQARDPVLLPDRATASGLSRAGHFECPASMKGRPAAEMDETCHQPDFCSQGDEYLQQKPTRIRAWWVGKWPQKKAARSRFFYLAIPGQA